MLKPLDIVFMKPFKDAYSSACARWMRCNSDMRIIELEIALVSAAYSKVCRLDIAQSGFQCKGIVPVQPDIFSDVDFVASEMTISARRNSDTDAEEGMESTTAAKCNKAELCL